MTKSAMEISRPEMHGHLVIPHVMFLTKRFPALLKVVEAEGKGKGREREKEGRARMNGRRGRVES